MPHFPLSAHPGVGRGRETALFSFFGVGGNNWALNSGPHACWTGALPLELLQPEQQLFMVSHHESLTSQTTGAFF
jgi:hypothetical protein